MTPSFNRRQFLECTGAGCGALAAGGLVSGPVLAAEGGDWPAPAPAKIFTLYAGRTGDDYLTRPTEELGRFQTFLAGLGKKLGDVQFIGGDMIPPAKVEELAPKVKAADGLLIIHLSHHGGNAPVLEPLVDLGLPTVLFSQPFSGHGWMDFPRWAKQGRKIVLIPSSDWNELERAATLMRVPARMKQTRILAIDGPNGTAAACDPAKVKSALGADLVTIPNAEVMKVFKSIDPKAAEAEAEDYWLSKARKIVEPTRDDVIASARLYLAIRQLMIDRQARAVCSRACMGTPRGCLSFSKLNDQGLVGACEGDIDSTLTMLLFADAFRVPGFITDPVIDTAQNAIVHFHCTSATKMDGPAGPRLPFTIRTQTDSRGGVALEVENRVDQPVVCAKLVNLNTLLACPGQIIATSTSPLACRTQFTQRVADARRLFLDWGADRVEGDTMTRLHRVVFYGDHMRGLEDLSRLMGLTLVEEGGARTA